ncbi:universal stress protein [Streptomyces sp. NPDC058067]|uniref:universal stress protein n=1 Tax=Streptomyces sp. NPDC058067 TaxID=3346324 RepID=UPI0036EC1977
MELPLVVGVDGSDASMRAVSWAADEAVLHGVPLRLVYASLWERYEGEALAETLGKPSERLPADNIVDAAAGIAHRRDPDLKVSTEVEHDDAISALVSEGRNASALVLASRGRSGVAEVLLGSVSLAVAARADCPVIVLRGSHDNQARTAVHRRVALGVADDQQNTEAVRFAFREAQLRGAALEAVRAWRCPARETVDHPLLTDEPARTYEARAVEILEAAVGEGAAAYPSVDLIRRTAEGPARKVLLGASAQADLLVVGARRRQGHLGLQIGLVTHYVLHHSRCPVAVVPQRG